MFQLDTDSYRLHAWLLLLYVLPGRKTPTIYQRLSVLCPTHTLLLFLRPKFVRFSRLCKHRVNEPSTAGARFDETVAEDAMIARSENSRREDSLRKIREALAHAEALARLVSQACKTFCL